MRAQSAADSTIVSGTTIIYDLRPFFYSTPSKPVRIKSDGSLLVNGAYRAQWWKTQIIDVEAHGKIIVEGGFCDNFIHTLQPGASIILKRRTYHAGNKIITQYAEFTPSGNANFIIPIGATLYIEEGSTMKYPCTDPINPPGYN